MRNFALVIAFVACIGISGCGESCGYAILSETKSPDGRLKAVAFQKDCGTDFDLTTEVSILSSQDRSLGRGNLFIARDGRRGVLADEKAPTDIKVTWNSNSSLTISYSKDSQVLLRKPGAAGVAVKYSLTP